MALQVVSILSSSKGALETDDPTAQKQGEQTRGGADHPVAVVSAGNKFSSSKTPTSRFGKTTPIKPVGSSTMASGGVVVSVGTTTGEVTPLNKYFRTFMVELLRMFDTDQSLLDNKGSFVIRSAWICMLYMYMYVQFISFY